MAKRRNRLHYKLALKSVQLALLLGLLISFSQVYLDLKNERNNIGQFVNEILKSSTEAATEAAYELDPYYSKTIVDGVIKYKSIANITLFDDRNNILAFAGRKGNEIESDWISDLIIGNQHIYSTPLIRNMDAVGSIKVTIDAQQLSDSFINRAKFIFLSGFFRSMALMTIFLIMFYFVLTRPLLKTISEISQLHDTPSDEAVNFGQHLIKRRDELGELVEIFLSLLERRKQAETEAGKAKQQYFHREKVASFGQMAAGILHEIGNPIASMSGSTIHLQEVNQDKTLSEQEVREENLNYLGIINEQTERLTVLTKQIANYVSPQEFELELLDLNTIIENNKNLLRYDKRLKAIPVEYFQDPQLPAIYAIQPHVVQIFLNLLLNSGRACQDNAEKSSLITVTTKSINLESKVYVLLSIADNGTGMDESVLKQAMEPFFTTKEVGSGTGLGLSLCHTLVDELGGKIEIDSEPGIGTEVSIYFATFDESQGSDNE